MNAPHGTDAPFAPTQVPRLARGVRLQWEAVPQLWILLYPEGRVELNGSAAEIMQRVDGKRSIGAIIEELQQTFAVPDLHDDVMAALAMARDHRWIEVGDAA
ncbi:MAG TPA: pyrroloquinoline quinone biosynthesis peptide chaperone PqqD [Hyphomicrobiales bacterium]|nr:pyrroloquinoline quinone biosynthesis peptide chaperone PqqD [Hyphomicrobiales bacterium]